MGDLNQKQTSQVVRVAGDDQSLCADVETKTTGENALHVISEGGTGVGPSPIPSLNVLYTSTHLKLNGTGSFDMNVDGDPTQQVFSIVPGAGETWYVESVTLFLQDGGSFDSGDFGSLGSLSNGCDLVIISKGVTHTIAHIEDNSEVRNEFPQDPLVMTSSSAAFDEDDLYSGSIKFKVPMILQNSTSDELRMEINDDIDGLDFFRARVLYWEVNP